MKIPRKPPEGRVLYESPERFMALLDAVESTLVQGRYRHWQKLRYFTPPIDATHEEWWAAIKFRRRSHYKQVPLQDRRGSPFVFAFADPMPEMVHRVDLGAGGHIQMPDQVTNPETRDAYCVSSLIDEAITSSQLEGATTTRPVAKQMIRTGRRPRDKSEQMILNNYMAMKKIGQLKNDKLTRNLVFEIHRIVTKNTLDDPSAAGRFRREDENVRVEDNEGTVFHEPPPADQLEDRMEDMSAFANSDSTKGGFVHPVLRSIILHFWLSYDHPFVDGNGRTARALFYWSMLRQKYWLCEYISISQIIRKAPVKYGKAFLYTETDDNDLTYFLLYHLRVIQRAIDELHAYITRKTANLQRLEAELRGMNLLNHRQRALIGHALRHPYQSYTISSHQNSHNVVYQTARTDLLDLADRNLLETHRPGKSYVFRPARDLESRLSQMP
jgi:Fic family protein